jgi:hypothetical protein
MFPGTSRTLNDMYMPLGTHVPPQGLPQPLPGGTAALIGAAALIVVMIPFSWQLAQHFDTMAHEGAHALAAFALGLTLESVVLKLEGGSTNVRSVGLTSVALRLVLFGFVGYLGPSAFGLAGAKLIETGRVVTVLWLAIILLVLLLFVLARSLGLVSVPVAIVLLVFVTRHGHAWVEEVVVYGMTWLLLLSGLRIALAHGVEAGDAGTLKDRTHIPRRIWSLLWIGGTLLAVVIGGKWMVLRS